MSETKEILIELSADDITHGTKKDCSDCPVARAVARALPGSRPEVFHEEIELYGKYRGTATTPSEISEFIEAFDDGVPVEPFRFTLKFEEFEQVQP